MQTQLKKETGKIEIINKDGKSVFIEVELANTTVKQMKGLMFRNSLGANEGMLFVFSGEQYRTFWMMNTTIALDAIHISANGSVVDIIQMDPCKSLVFCKRYTPKAKGKYVLEVNQGFAEKNGIEIGNSRLMIKE
jgi:uncharacterized membrane protein (UPF0127 family)